MLCKAITAVCWHGARYKNEAHRGSLLWGALLEHPLYPTHSIMSSTLFLPKGRRTACWPRMLSLNVTAWLGFISNCNNPRHPSRVKISQWHQEVPTALGILWSVGTYHPDLHNSSNIQTRKKRPLSSLRSKPEQKLDICSDLGIKKMTHHPLPLPSITAHEGQTWRQFLTCCYF